MEPRPSRPSISRSINSAPDVEIGPQDRYFIPTGQELTFNPRVEDLYAPDIGPKHPLIHDMSNHPSGGHIESMYLDPIAFREQHQCYDTLGYCRSLDSSTEFWGDQQAARVHQGKTSHDKRVDVLPRGGRAKRSDPNYDGPWTPHEEVNKAVTGLDKESYKEVIEDRLSHMNDQQLQRWRRKHKLDAAGNPIEEPEPTPAQPEGKPTQSIEVAFKAPEDDDEGEKQDARAPARGTVALEYIEPSVSGELLAERSMGAPLGKRAHEPEDEEEDADARRRMRSDPGADADAEGADAEGAATTTTTTTVLRPTARSSMEAELRAKVGPEGKAGIVTGGVIPLSKDQAELTAQQNLDNNIPVGGRRGVTYQPRTERTQFHGRQTHDYQGRTYIFPPSELKPSEHRCFLPKKVVHTWAGHQKGVSAMRFFPKYGHILLSAGLDCQLKIWDCYGRGRRCLRTIYGHDKAIRDICFNTAGDRFISAAFDQTVRLWDTETGQCLARYTNGTIPYCAKFHPVYDNIFLAGCSDKKIIQWDTREHRIVQRYNEHLGAVNTVTFLEGNRRFVSSSDDKALRIWEWGIPVTCKLIAEPHMHSMPSIALHASQKYFLAQSLDNQILVYGAADRFKLNKKKRFTGHIIAGYNCQVGSSADGKYIISGDAEGNVHFWNWNNCRFIKRLKCHDKVTVGCQWHPIEPSKMATCSWDGTIRYWD
eukprot:gnl/Trimastix_PCT/2248.p1 GENE.gnl/Trimastix_PCT/2248~~gnl/Trimastix_PCT/2248.p1  ORF type:complete len:706 (-),score=248.61 gnl/Trimastix_PCT/2248:172-2289(-)